MDADIVPKFDFLVKIVLIGDTNVGKTNILSRLVDNRFNSDSKATIGVEFGSKIFKFDSSTVKVQIWDTAGQERYHAITTAYYRGSAGAVLVYDICNEASLDHIRSIWLMNLNTVLESSIPKMLLGNKHDLESERKIGTESGRALAVSENMAFFETSAFSGENINPAFESFVRTIYEMEKDKIVPAGSKNKIGVAGLKGHELSIKKKKKRSSCC